MLQTCLYRAYWSLTYKIANSISVNRNLDLSVTNFNKTQTDDEIINTSLPVSQY